MLRLNSEQFESALLPIKPVYVEKILSGEKKVEFRKVNFKKNISKLVIYSSSPVKKVVAICDIKQIKEFAPSTTWLKYKEVSGISRKDFFEYYQNKSRAVSIEICSVKVLSQPLSLELVIDCCHVPQSYQYLTLEQTKRVEVLPFKDIL